MEIGTTGSAEYRQREPGRVDTHLSLDLQTVDALDLSRIAEDLQARRNDIRSQIFRKIANEVIPSMMEGLEMDIPEQWSIESNGSGTGTMASPKLSNGVLNTDHHLEVDFSFRADREIDPATMIYLARAQIAGHIADSTVFDLESRFLGKTESSVSSEHSTKDGEVGDYRVSEEGEEPERESDAPTSNADRKTAPRMEEAANDDDFILDVPDIRAVAGEEEMASNDNYYDKNDSTKSILEAETYEDFLMALIRDEEDYLRGQRKYLNNKKASRDDYIEYGIYDNDSWNENIAKSEAIIRGSEERIRAKQAKLQKYRKDSMKKAA